MRAVPALDLRGAASPGEWDLVAAALDDFPLLAIHDTGTDEAPEWRVFFRDTGDRDRAAAVLVASFPSITATPVLVEDDDWARRSQAALGATRVGRLIVAPPWDVPSGPGDDAHVRSRTDGDRVIVIEPSTGFGTGHHETTRLCLSLLQEQDVRGRRVLDVGTGSGVLAIAAVVLGASHVTAIDVDPDALDNARENARLNGIALEPTGGSTPALTIARADLRQLDAPADIVLANLTGALLVSSADRLADQLAPGGSLIVSGLLHAETGDVLGAFGRVPLSIVAHRRDGEWGAMVFRRE